MNVEIGEIETVQTVIDREERFSFCCYAPPLGGIEEYGFCGACGEQTEFLADFWFHDMDRESDERQQQKKMGVK